MDNKADLEDIYNLLEEILAELKELNKKSPGVVQVFPQNPLQIQPHFEPMINTPDTNLPYPYNQPSAPIYTAICKNENEVK